MKEKYMLHHETVIRNEVDELTVRLRREDLSLDIDKPVVLKDISNGLINEYVDNVRVTDTHLIMVVRVKRGYRLLEITKLEVTEVNLLTVVTGFDEDEVNRNYFNENVDVSKFDLQFRYEDNEDLAIRLISKSINFIGTRTLVSKLTKKMTGFSVSSETDDLSLALFKLFDAGFEEDRTTTLVIGKTIEIEVVYVNRDAFYASLMWVNKGSKKHKLMFFGPKVSILKNWFSDLIEIRNRHLTIGQPHI